MALLPTSLLGSEIEVFNCKNKVINLDQVFCANHDLIPLAFEKKSFFCLLLLPLPNLE